MKGENKFKKYSKKLELKEELLDFGENSSACVLRKVCEILKQGLNKRLSLVDVTKAHFPPVSTVNMQVSQHVCKSGLLLIDLTLMI